MALTKRARAERLALIRRRHMILQRMSRPQRPLPSSIAARPIATVVR